MYVELKKYAFLTNNSKKIFLAILISMIWVTTLTPMVFAAGTQIRVTFDPNGSLSFSVNPNTYNFTSVLAGSYRQTATGWGTMWNNGSVQVNVTIYTNVSSDAPNHMICQNGAAPAADHYALNGTGLLTTNYFPTSKGATLYAQVNGGTTSLPFGLRVTIGATLSKNWSYERTTINFSATQS